ncbi:helix-turn-helix domain-containing protein [Actinoallomurus sp. CA-150999]|uniref:helix-turn-helix domain-containing protein n=1 Tax=Actinoallomurus sp. CA-150999 TaxID=3239887 RepID=UPI003D8BE022
MDMDASHVLADVGRRLRSLRHGRDMRLAELAEATGISESTLSRLETGRLRPTLAQLVPLARVYDVTLDDLVGLPDSERQDKRMPVIHRHGAVFVPLTRRPGGIQAYKMFSPARHTLPPPDPCSHKGFQWLYVLSGRLRVLLGDQDFVLKPGESAEFDTGVPHWMGHADHESIELLMLFGPEGERAKLMARAEALKKAHSWQSWSA